MILQQNVFKGYNINFSMGFKSSALRVMISGFLAASLFLNVSQRNQNYNLERKYNQLQKEFDDLNNHHKHLIDKFNRLEEIQNNYNQLDERFKQYIIPPIFYEKKNTNL